MTTEVKEIIFEKTTLLQKFLGKFDLLTANFLDFSIFVVADFSLHYLFSFFPSFFGNFFLCFSILTF